MAERNPRPDGTGRTPAVRFAPSPNGYLHLGHAYSALFTDAVAKALSARFILRIEDIDQTRSRLEFVDQIFSDLDWLGLEWEEQVCFQSQNMETYAQAIRTLAARGLVYATRASRRDIADYVAEQEALGRQWPRDPDGAPLFPGIGRTAPGDMEDVAIRIDMTRALDACASTELAFHEIGPVRGADEPVPANPGKWGDAVLARRDIATSYHLSVVVDDALQGVTHVTRGMDLFEATNLHRLLQHLLGLPTPIYCHHGLLTDRSGRKLAKTRASQSLRELRQTGATPADIRQATGIDEIMPWLERACADWFPNPFRTA